MRVLYAAFRHDPLDPDAASGADHQFYAAVESAGAELRLVGPFRRPEALPERVFRRLYPRLGGGRPHKYPLSLCRRAGRELSRAAAGWRPDVILTLFPATLVFYRGAAPAVLRLDTTFLGQHDGWPLYGRLALAISTWQERRAFARAAKLLTHSRWSERWLREGYGVAAGDVEVFPNPAALPRAVVPAGDDPVLAQGLDGPLRLLLVGRDYRRKGVDLALRVLAGLRESGVGAELTVCGSRGPAAPGVRWVGPFSKRDPSQLSEYVALYARAHVLLHPALFDASPIVPSEAAAFGVPTVAQDVGGLATSVADGESGVILPAGSPVAEWVRVLSGLAGAPERYAELRRSTRRRYERELCWEAAGRRLMGILEEVARGRPGARVVP